MIKRYYWQKLSLIDNNNMLEDFIRKYDNNVQKTKYKNIQ